MQLIKILRQGLAESSQNKDKERLFISQVYKKKIFPSIEKTTDADSQLFFPFAEEKEASAFYSEALELTCVVLDKTLKREPLPKEAIKELVLKTIEAFKQTPYGPLLFYIYSHTAENYLIAHVVNNMILSVAFAKSLGIPETQILELGLCAYCHDLGMIFLYDLYNTSDSISSQEFKRMLAHPHDSAVAASGLVDGKSLPVIESIHERYNGQGYPRGIKGDEIPVWAQIIGVCDIYVALVHPRFFRKAHSPSEAIKMVVGMKDVLFKKEIIIGFIDFLSVYPVGSLVYLNTNETAVVIAGNAGRPTAPVVQVILNPKGEILETPQTIDLSKDTLFHIRDTADKDKEREITLLMK